MRHCTIRKPNDNIILDAGKELQRCLYAFAEGAVPDGNISISALLLYACGEVDLRLEDREANLVELAGYLRDAHVNLLSGRSVLGADTGRICNDIPFALPANDAAAYCKRKIASRHRAFRGRCAGLGDSVMNAPLDAARRRRSSTHRHRNS